MRVLLGSDAMPTRRFSLRWLWEPRDVWVGVFWNVAQVSDDGDRALLVYIGFIPCLPLCFVWFDNAVADRLSPQEPSGE